MTMDALAKAAEKAAEDGDFQTMNKLLIAILLTDSRIDPAAKDNYAIKLASTCRDSQAVGSLLADPRVFDKLNLAEHPFIKECFDQAKAECDSRVQSFALFYNKHKDIAEIILYRGVIDLDEFWVVKDYPEVSLSEKIVRLQKEW